jgi:hypothetical protein
MVFAEVDPATGEFGASDLRETASHSSVSQSEQIGRVRGAARSSLLPELR